MTPVFITLTQPSNKKVKTLARNMNIAFVCTIELIAVASDIMLLHRFTLHKDKNTSQRVRVRMVKDMWIVYAFVWLTICADVSAKVRANTNSFIQWILNLHHQIYRDVTNTLLPDLVITNLTLTLRCMAALMYGTTIHNALEVSSQRSSPWNPPVSKLPPRPFASTGAPSEIKLVEIGEHHRPVGADRVFDGVKGWTDQCGAQSVRSPKPDFTITVLCRPPSRVRIKGQGIYHLYSDYFFSSFCSREKCHIFLVSILIYLGLRGPISGP